jgi:putative hydrolase of the HAD superfamily
MLEALTFDVGGTLADGELNQESYQAELLEYLQGLGFEISPARYRKVMGSALQRLGKLRERFMEPKFEEFYSEVLDRLRVPSRPEILREIRAIYGRNFPQVLKQGVRETLQDLRGTYKLGVVSNSLSGLPRDFLEKEGLAGYFRVVVLSRDMGIRKPDPRIFHAAMQRLGVEPAEAAHVGNSLEEDVKGAKGAGMKAVLFGEGAGRSEVKPDLVVRSISELPSALQRL